MVRYDTDIRDCTLHLKTNDESVVAGPMDDICELVGGETYIVEYDENQRKVAWLDADADGRISFEVRDTIATMDYNEEFVSEIKVVDTKKTAKKGIHYGHPCSPI